MLTSKLVSSERILLFANDREGVRPLDAGKVGTGILVRVSGVTFLTTLVEFLSTLVEFLPRRLLVNDAARAIFGALETPRRTGSMSTRCIVKDNAGTSQRESICENWQRKPLSTPHKEGLPIAGR